MNQCHVNMPNVRIGNRFRDCDAGATYLPVDRANGREEITEMTDGRATPEPAHKPLSPAAQRALAEAEERRRQAAANAKPMEKEYQGPKGPEPTRYGDWENKGIASDF
jgi:hypothetical protein